MFDFLRNNLGRLGKSFMPGRAPDNSAQFILNYVQLCITEKII